MFNNLFKRTRKKYFKKTDSLKEFETISLWTAGIKYESRITNLIDCKIHEKVTLERQPKNKVDKNAIQVIKKDGKSLGFIGMLNAKILAPLLDDCNVWPTATIIEIKCDLNKENYGVKIALYIKSDFIKLFINEDIDYSLELSTNENLYLLVDCDEKTLTKVKRLLIDNGIENQYSGVSYRTSANGRNYDWYIKLMGEVNQVRIKDILEKHFPVLKEKSNRAFENEYLELQDEQIDKQDEQLDKLKNNNSYFQKENEKLGKKISRFQNKIIRSEDSLRNFVIYFFQILFLFRTL